MSSDQMNAIVILFVVMTAWNVVLSICVCVNLNLIHRLDDCVAGALKALGFPKKSDAP